MALRGSKKLQFFCEMMSKKVIGSYLKRITLLAGFYTTLANSYRLPYRFQEHLTEPGSA